MEINIPKEQQAQLAAFALQHGYDTPEQYASTIILQAVQQEAFAALSSEELEKSKRSIELGIADVEAGRCQPADQAMDDIARKFGFDIPR